MTPRDTAIQAVRDATMFIAGDRCPGLRVLVSGEYVDIVLEALKGCAVGHDGIVYRVEQVSAAYIGGVAVLVTWNEGRSSKLVFRRPDRLEPGDEILYRLVEEDQ